MKKPGFLSLNPPLRWPAGLLKTRGRLCRLKRHPVSNRTLAASDHCRLPVEDQLRIITRGIEKIVPQEELRKKLQHSRDTGTPLKMKYGIDLTGIDVHLGHTVPLRKMRQFQDLGHQAVIIIGNYTALVGDPSGRDEARSKRLTEAEVETNAKTYLEQVGKSSHCSCAEVHRNGDWFGKCRLRMCFRFADESRWLSF